MLTYVITDGQPGLKGKEVTGSKLADVQSAATEMVKKNLKEALIVDASAKYITFWYTNKTGDKVHYATFTEKE